MSDDNVNASQKFNQAANTTSLIHQSYSDYAKKFSLSYNELSVLYALVAEKICTQKQICQTWALPKQTIHNICKKWMDEGIIQVSENAEDKREKLMMLSQAGEAFAFPIIKPLLALEHLCIEQFGEENMNDFLSHFKQLQGIISQNIGSNLVSI